MRAAPGCTSLLFFLALLVLIPFFLANAMLTALARLGLTPEISLLAATGIFFGGMVNIPVRKIPREQTVELRQLSLFGLSRLRPVQVRTRSFTLIAVNVGGCVIPSALAAYELYRVAATGWEPLLLALAAVALNVAVCWKVARPIENVGIAMPALAPALVAALAAILLLPEFAPPVAFAAGVLGPLIGADLLHLDEVKKIATGLASIGGAGTFDGIVISGLLATLLA